MGRNGLDHTKADKTLYSFKNINTEEILHLTKYEFSKISGSRSVGKLISGFLKTSKGWSIP
jgi:hypothetical protein